MRLHKTFHFHFDYTGYAVSILLTLLLLVVSDTPAHAEASSLVVHQWEAEHGMTSPSIEVVSDASASGGKYIAYSSTSEAGLASYLFNVPDAGMYQLKGRIKFVDPGSFPFAIKWSQKWGEDFQDNWFLPSDHATWEWVYGPQLELSSGLVMLTVSYQEPQAKLDKLELRLKERSSLPAPAASGERPDNADSIYVDPSSGSDSNKGAADAPLKTLEKALSIVKPGQSIKLRSGIYTEQVETQTDGLPDAPIVIEPDGNANPIIDGNERDQNGPKFRHSHYIIRNLEFRNFNIGVFFEGVTGVRFENNHVHHVNGECVHIRQFSTWNTLSYNTIHDCGLKRNGEGIYIGTAPEQREKNDGLADQTILNTIANNKIFRVTEGIDIKEDASFNKITFNYIRHATSEGSGGINVRGDRNFFSSNLIEHGQGSGFRFGGDGAYNPLVEGWHRYGVNNVLRYNVVQHNESYGYKLIQGPQDIDYTNTGIGNDGDLFHLEEYVPLDCTTPSEANRSRQDIEPGCQLIGEDELDENQDDAGNLITPKQSPSEPPDVLNQKGSKEDSKPSANTKPSPTPTPTPTPTPKGIIYGIGGNEDYLLYPKAKAYTWPISNENSFPYGTFEMYYE